MKKQYIYIYNFLSSTLFENWKISKIIIAQNNLKPYLIFVQPKDIFDGKLGDWNGVPIGFSWDFSGWKGVWL